MHHRLVNLVVRCNWMFLFIGSILGFILAEPAFTRGIFFGGLITTINFHLLARTLYKAFIPGCLGSHNVVLVKYYLRFIASGLIIFLLMQQRFVNPIGLFVGLSVVVMSIIIAVMVELKKLIFKEAI